jgi:hypothetical protein
MVRKQVYIESEQDDRLKRQAASEGTTESELIRRGIDLVTGKNEERRREEAWQWLLEFMKQRAKMKVPQSPRTWTRDDLYDDDPE